MASEITQRQRAEQFYNSLLKSAGVLGYETPRGRFKRLQLLLAHDQQTRQEALTEAKEAMFRLIDGQYLTAVQVNEAQAKISRALDRLAREGVNE